MSQLNVNVIAPLGYTGPDLPGDNNFVQIVDNAGDTVLKIPNGNNIAIGKDALNTITTGLVNTAVGDGSMGLVTTGNANSAFGAGALGGLTTGTWNIGIGPQSGQTLDSGSENVFVGYQAGYGDFANPPGNQNTCIGTMAGFNMSGSQYNTYIGWNAGFNTTTGNNNVCLGNYSDAATATSSNSITLGNSLNTILRCAVTSITSLSDARDKKDVKELGAGLDFVKGLKPVEFVWDDRDEKGRHDVKDFGFIAQDLKKSQEDAGLAETLKLVYEENPEKLEASYGKLVPILVKAIQDLSKEIEILKSK
jgi:hypothetical protein